MRLFAGILVVTVAGCGGLQPDGGGGDGPPLSSGRADAPAVVSSSPYRAPWACGGRYYVSQGNDGDLCTTNNGDHVQLQAYAWDFALPRHTQVLAARSGVVTLALTTVGPGDHCYDGCPAPYGTTEFTTCCKSCLLLSNRVNVMHDDGSVATYWHLDQIAVREGQRVATGDPIGYSGTSGCSTGPHLHFQVMKTCPTGFCQSEPIDFGEARVPACGDHVTSANGCP